MGSRCNVAVINADGSVNLSTAGNLQPDQYGSALSALGRATAPPVPDPGTYEKTNYTETSSHSGSLIHYRLYKIKVPTKGQVFRWFIDSTQHPYVSLNALNNPPRGGNTPEEALVSIKTQAPLLIINKSTEPVRFGQPPPSGTWDVVKEDISYPRVAWDYSKGPQPPRPDYRWRVVNSGGKLSEEGAKFICGRRQEETDRENQQVLSAWRARQQPLPSPEQQGENLAKLIEQMQQTGTPAPSYNPSASLGPIPAPKSKLPLIIGGVALVATVAALWWRFRK